MLAQDIDYFSDKQIPCSSSGYHILTKEEDISIPTKSLPSMLK